MIFLMRELSNKYKVSVRSIGELAEFFTGLTAQYQARRVTFVGEKLTKELLINSLLAWIMEQPPAEQDRMLREGAEKLHLLLSRDAPEQFDLIDKRPDGMEMGVDERPPMKRGAGTKRA